MPYRSAVPLAVFVSTGISTSCLFPNDPVIGEEDINTNSFIIVQAADTALLMPTADTHVRRGSQNRNDGDDDLLRLQSGGNNRALIEFDQQAITETVGDGILQSASLTFEILDNGDNFGGNGRFIGVHRLSDDWTEAGATWFCSNDTDTSNRLNCDPADQWNMEVPASWPFVAEQADSLLIINGLLGTVTFDVTSDVEAWLDGVANEDWVTRLMDEDSPGRLRLGSRASASPATLSLIVEAIAQDTSRPVVPDVGPPPSDSVPTIAGPPGTTARYFTNIFEIIFEDSLSGVSVQEILNRYDLTIVGGVPSDIRPAYYVRIPDSTLSIDELFTLGRTVMNEPGVFTAGPLPSLPQIRPNSRFPNDRREIK